MERADRRGVIGVGERDLGRYRIVERQFAPGIGADHGIGDGAGVAAFALLGEMHDAVGGAQHL